uniref:Uncharacterized protein n=1 Tax=Daphnia magna TaxID=35525 RepID=A0A0P6HMI9_9CRUS
MFVLYCVSITPQSLVKSSSYPTLLVNYYGYYIEHEAIKFWFIIFSLEPNTNRASPSYGIS